MGRVLPLASAMGVNFNEVGAAFAALSRTGTNAAEAATQIRGILASLLRPTKQAEEALTEMGLSSEGLRRQMREEGLLATLKTLSEEFAGNEAAAASVFGNIRALSGVLDLMGANVATTEAIFASMADTTGAVDEAFAAVSQTTAFQFQQAMAEMKEVLLTLGQTLLPLVNDGLELISGAVQGVAGFFQGLSPPLQDTALALGGVLAIAGPVALGIGGVTTAMLALKSAAMAHPYVAAFATAVGLVSAALAIHYRESREARERQEALTEEFKKAGDPAATLTDRLSALADEIKRVRDEADGGAEAIETFIGGATLQAALSAREVTGEFATLGLSIEDLLPGLETGTEGFGEMANQLRNMPADIDSAIFMLRDQEGVLGEVGKVLGDNIDSFDDYSEAQIAAVEAAREILQALDETATAFRDHTQKIEDDARAFVQSEEIYKDFAGLLGEDVVQALIASVEAGEPAADALQRLARMAEYALDAESQFAWEQKYLNDQLAMMSDVADVAADDTLTLVTNLMDAADAAGYDARKTRDLINQLGLLDQLDPQVVIDLGLDITGAAQVIKFVDDLIEAQKKALMAAGDGRFIMRALEPLFALRTALTGALDPKEVKDDKKSPASSAMDELERAEKEAAREAERLQREIERLMERVEDMGKVLGDEDFFEFLLGASADQIEDRFEDIAEAAMELVEQANELNVPGGPQFLQALAVIGEQFDALAAVQSQVASTQEDIARAEDRLASATSDLASAQADLNRENERYAAFLYGEGAGGGTFEQVLQTEIDVYRNLQRELAGLEQEQTGFRQRIIDMMSPTVAGAGGAGGVLGNLGNILAQARTFRNNLIELRDRGFPTDVIGQVVAAGMTNGNVISRRLLALGTAEFEEFLSLRDEISRIGVETAAIAGEVIFGADIAEAQGAVGAQFAVVDAMFQSAIARAAANVREQAAVVDRLRGALGALQGRLAGLQDQVEVLAGGIQAALTAAFTQFLAGFNDSITRIAQVANVPAPPPPPAPAQVSRPASAPERVTTPTRTPAPAPAPAPAPLPPLSQRYPDRPTARPTPELAFGRRTGGGGGGPLRMMANGGPVSGGRPYLVGEMGPELFVPAAAGNIIPSSQTAAMTGGGTTYNINVTTYGDPAEAGRQIVKQIQEYERRNGSTWRS